MVDMAGTMINNISSRLTLNIQKTNEIDELNALLYNEQDWSDCSITLSTVGSQ